jgi:hypothetical protein
MGPHMDILPNLPGKLRLAAWFIRVHLVAATL